MSPKTIVFIHGYADNSKLFLPLFSLLEKRLNRARSKQNRYHFISLDLPTVSHPNKKFTLDQLTNHAASLINSLPQSKVHLVGFSLGGLAAINIAHKIPQKISSLLLLNTSPKLVIPFLYKPFLFIKNHWLLKLFSNLKFNTSYNLQSKSEIGVVLTLQDIIKKTSNTNDLLNKYKNLKLKKQIILFKDDHLVLYQPNHQFLQKHGIQTRSINHGGHARSKTYWHTIARQIQLFLN